MSERKAGWYWVSEHEPPHDSWEPIWFDREGFHVGGRERWGSSDFGLIGPRIPTPDEPCWCVPVEGLQVLRNSISGDTYLGDERELVIIEEMLADAKKTLEEVK